MREDGQEKIGGAEISAAQRRREGVAKVRVFDPFAAQHAAGRHIAFNDFRTKLAIQLVVSRQYLRSPYSPASGIRLPMEFRREAPRPPSALSLSRRH